MVMAKSVVRELNIAARAALFNTGTSDPVLPYATLDPTEDKPSFNPVLPYAILDPQRVKAVI